MIKVPRHPVSTQSPAVSILFYIMFATWVTVLLLPISGVAMFDNVDYRLGGTANLRPAVGTALAVASLAFGGGFFLTRFRKARKRPDSESPNHSLLSTTFDCVLQLDAGGRIVHANPAAIRVFGGTQKSLRGIQVNSLFVAVEINKTRCAFDFEQVLRSLQDDGVRELLAIAISLHGATLPVELRIVRTEEFRNAEYLLILREVSRRHNAEQAARHSESKYRNLFCNMPDGAFQSRSDGRILTANPALVRMLGYESELELCQSANAISFYRFPGDREQLTKALADVGDVRNREIELRRRDGSIVIVRANVRSFLDEQSCETIFEGTFSDITDLVRTREMLKDSQEYFEAITRHALDAVFVIDEACTILYASPSSVSVTGVETSDALGQNCLDRVHKDDLTGVTTSVQKCFRNPGRTERFTFRIRKPDGNTIFVESVGSAYANRFGEARAVIHARDITKRLRTEAQLQHVQKLQAVGQLTGGIAHDFNNLLTVIVGNLQQLIEQLDDPDLKTSADTALRASFQGADLTRRLLAFSSRQFLEPKVVDVNELLRAMEPIFRRSLRQPLSLDIRYVENIWLAKADPAQLESALLNLAINARDSIVESGTVSIATENFRLSTDCSRPCVGMEPGEYVRIFVADTGCGMAYEIAQRAVEPFFSTKEEGHGTGLGLSMVYGFVKQSGGFFQIESDPGCGTTISIYLPRCADEVKISPAPSIPRDVPRGSETILVVDDNRDVRDTTVANLKSFGYSATAAVDSRHALSILLSDDIDLVITDIMMPGVSGLDLVKMAREQRPKVRFLLTTGNSDRFETGSDPAMLKLNVLDKPFTRQELAARVRRVLDADNGE